MGEHAQKIPDAMLAAQRVLEGLDLERVRVVATAFGDLVETARAQRPLKSSAEEDALLFALIQVAETSRAAVGPQYGAILLSTVDLLMEGLAEQRRLTRAARRRLALRNLAYALSTFSLLVELFRREEIVEVYSGTAPVESAHYNAFARASEEMRTALEARRLPQMSPPERVALLFELDIFVSMACLDDEGSADLEFWAARAAGDARIVSENLEPLRTVLHGLIGASEAGGRPIASAGGTGELDAQSLGQWFDGLLGDATERRTLERLATAARKAEGDASVALELMTAAADRKV